jgi:hypothetical protein
MSANTVLADGVRRDRRRVAGALFAFVLAVYVFTAGGSFATTDAVVMYDQAKQIVEARSAALSRDVVGSAAYRGVDGRVYSPFGLLQSLYDIPFYVAGRAVQRMTSRGGPSDTIPKAMVALANTLPMAAAAWLVFLIASRLWGSVPDAAIAALAIALGSICWVYAKFGYNAPLATACLAAATHEAIAATRGGHDRRLAGAGLALGLGLLTRHELVAAALPVALFVVLETPSPRKTVLRLAWLAAGALPPALVWLWWNAIRFGHPLDTGYLRDTVPGFGSPLASGLYGLLLSPTASVFAYAPLVLLGTVALARLWRTDRAVTLLLAGQAVTMLLVYAQLENWRGGRSYGPRYLVPLVPLVCLPLAAWLATADRVTRRVLVGVSVACAIWTLPGVLVDFSKIGVERAREIGAVTAEQRMHDWSRAPLVENLRASVEAVPRNVRYLAGWERPPAIARGGDGSELGQQLAFGLDFWWLSAFYLGLVPRWVSLAALAFGILAIGATGSRLARIVWGRP